MRPVCHVKVSRGLSSTPDERNQLQKLHVSAAREIDFLIQRLDLPARYEHAKSVGRESLEGALVLTLGVQRVQPLHLVAVQDALRVFRLNETSVDLGTMQVKRFDFAPDAFVQERAEGNPRNVNLPFPRAHANSGLCIYKVNDHKHGSAERG